MRKILVNAYMEENFGDDLFLEMLFSRYKDITWILNTSNKRYTEIYSNYPNVKIIKNKLYKVCKKINALKLFFMNFDAVIFIGGSIFIQYKQWEYLYNERCKLLNAFRYKKKYIIGANFGPYYDEKFIYKYSSFFDDITDICFRDKYSYYLFKDKKNVRVCPDIVFGIEKPNNEKVKNTIGISVINLEGRDDLTKYKEVYIGKMRELTEQAIRLGKQVSFFSFCNKQNDLDTINEIYSLLSEENRLLVKIEQYNGNINEFYNKLSHMENIIATRFHACVLSQVMGQGLYPIIYSEKTYNMLQDINFTKEYIRIEDIELLDVGHVMDAIESNRIEISNVKIDAVNQFKGLDNYVENKE